MMKKSVYSLFTILYLLWLSACTEDKVGDMNNMPNLRPLSVPEQELVQTSNDFAFEIFKKVEELSDKDNIFISPLSISVALHMTANGAEGDTKAQIKSVLGVDQLSDAEANQAVEDLTELLLSMDKKVALSIANSIWYKNTFTLKPVFDQLIRDHYNGRIEGLDFSKPEVVKNTINSWVEQKTNGKIRNLLENVPAEAVMYLVNAIYFKADWQYQFDPSRTEVAPFYAETAGEVKVPTMFSEGVKYETYYHEKFRLLDLPYGNGQYRMTVLLPHPDFTTADVLAELSADQLDNWLEQADTTSTELYMPKFKDDFKIELSSPLAELGMGIAFSNNADFGGFFQEEVGEALKISRVIHQSFIEVSEQGTEAAAATVVEIIFTSTQAPRVPSVVRIDRSFVYLIREEHSGAILFAGKMTNPKE